MTHDAGSPALHLPAEASLTVMMHLIWQAQHLLDQKGPPSTLVEPFILTMVSGSMPPVTRVVVESVRPPEFMAFICHSLFSEGSVITGLQDLEPGRLLGTYNGEVCLQSEYNESRAYDLTMGDNLKDDKTKDLWTGDSRPPFMHPLRDNPHAAPALKH